MTLELISLPKDANGDDRCKGFATTIDVLCWLPIRKALGKVDDAHMAFAESDTGREDSTAWQVKKCFVRRGAARRKRGKLWKMEAILPYINGC